MTGGMTTTNADPNDVTNSLTRRLVNITTPGTNVVTCSAGLLSKKAVTIIVQQGTLRLANAIVFVNNNDDNGDGIPDKDDPLNDPGSSIAGEGDLMQIGLNLQCVKGSVPTVYTAWQSE